MSVFKARWKVDVDRASKLQSSSWRKARLGGYWPIGWRVSVIEFGNSTISCCYKFVYILII